MSNDNYVPVHLLTYGLLGDGHKIWREGNGKRLHLKKCVAVATQTKDSLGDSHVCALVCVFVLIRRGTLHFSSAASLQSLLRFVHHFRPPLISPPLSEYFNEVCIVCRAGCASDLFWAPSSYVNKFAA